MPTYQTKSVQVRLLEFALYPASGARDRLKKKVTFYGPAVRMHRWLRRKTTTISFFRCTSADSDQVGFAHKQISSENCTEVLHIRRKPFPDAQA